VPIVVGKIIPGPAVSASSGVIGTTGTAQVVTGYDGQPAAGRTVLILGRDQYGNWVVVAQTMTDAAGNYAATVNAGPNDRFIAVGIGDPAHGEHTRALGDLEAA